MKNIVLLIVASLMVAVAAAMLEDGLLTLPFLVGYLLGIVVPVVVYSGVLTLVAAGIYRVFTGKKMPNVVTVLWGIWVLVAAVNFYGNYHQQQERRAEQELLADPSLDWKRDGTLLPLKYGEDQASMSSTTLTLQARFTREFRQLDSELARMVTTIRVPPLFDPVFLGDKSRFPAAEEQLEDYARLFKEYKDKRKKLVSRMRGEIEQLDLPRNEKWQAVQEFENTYEIDIQLSGKYYDIVIGVSRQGIAYLGFLEQAHYKVSSGRVTFESESESEKFQEYAQTFKRLSEQEVAAQRELAYSREKRMARLRELSR